jgi:predicted TPR repeat methyltransferase
MAPDESRSVEMSIGDAVQLGIRLHRQGKVDDAVVIYRQILAAVPDQVDALHFLGVAEHQKGRSEKALELLDRAASLAPDLPDVHNNRGNVLKLLGRLDEAEAAYRRVIELRPDDAAAHNNLGTVLRERGRIDEAVETYRRVISKHPDFYEAHQNLGNTLAALERFDEALESHRRALELRPGAGESYRHLGGMFYAMGQIVDALKIYRQWISIEPDNPVAKHMIAACSGSAVPDRAPDDYVRAEFDRFAETFDGSLARLEYRAPSLVAEAVTDALGASGKAQGVLDAGCGTGLCARHLRPIAERLVGVDLSERMIERARARGEYDELVVAELTDFLRQHPRSYDLVVSADTLVYFGALDAVVAAAFEALRPCGVLVFTAERSEQDAAPSGYRIHPHGRYSHTEIYLRRVLDDTGFEVKGVRPVTLRKEAGKWVSGTLVVARKPAATSPRPS